MFKLAPPVRFERTTIELTARCSTIELQRNIFYQLYSYHNANYNLSQLNFFVYIILIYIIIKLFRNCSILQ